MTEAKIDIVHVAYKGASPALQELIGGQTQMMFATAASVIGHIKSGLVRPIAVTQLTRISTLPDIPTMDELGLKGFDAVTWHGFVAPAGTPKEVVDKLAGAIAAALKDPGVRKSLTELGVDIVGNTPAEFSAYIKVEIPKWTAVVKASGARVD
jgi:tripartite-type tricarboxylate transporter receptor subunit TctC